MESQAANSNLLDVSGVARLLGVSESWVRRHEIDLPTVRVGRMIRFNGALLLKAVEGRMSGGKSLRPERTMNMPSRYQRGFVFVKGKNLKTWYGVFREDIQKSDGQMERRQRKVRLGTLAELPTKNSARNRLAEIINSSSTPVAPELRFRDLAERWVNSEGPTIKPSSLLHYRNALRMYVLPLFGEQAISSINRETVQRFLADKAATYSRSALRSMRTVLSMTLGWAAACGWVALNPCVKVRLPRDTGGKQITRTVLTPEQIGKLARALEEPYQSLVLLLAATGLRISEAIAIKSTDIDSDKVLSVSRRIYVGAVDSAKSVQAVRRIPLESKLAERLRVIGAEHEWVFRSEAGTPVNPGNALKRYVQPAARSLGITLGGWHDFRHTLSTTLRRAGAHPKVIADILGHRKVNLAMDVYDRTDVADLRKPLESVVNALLPSCYPTEPAA